MYEVEAFVDVWRGRLAKYDHLAVRGLRLCKRSVSSAATIVALVCTLSVLFLLVRSSIRPILSQILLALAAISLLGHFLTAFQREQHRKAVSIT